MTTTALETVAHWIGGERVHDASRYGEVTDPATGAVTRRVAFASAATSTAPSRPPRPASRRGARMSLTKRANVLFRFRELLAARAGDLARVITAEHGKTLDDARGEVQRGLEVVEFACGAAHLLKGEASEQRRHRRRLALAAPAARRGGRHHAVQLPRDGPDVDVPAGARVRQRLHPQAEREGPVGVAADGRVARRGRPARRRVQRRPRRQGGGRGAAHPPGRRVGLLRRLDADRALRLRDRARRTASACRRSAARRTTPS